MTKATIYVAERWYKAPNCKNGQEYLFISTLRVFAHRKDVRRFARQASSKYFPIYTHQLTLQFNKRHLKRLNKAGSEGTRDLYGLVPAIFA